MAEGSHKEILQPHGSFVHTYSAAHPPIATVRSGEPLSVHTVDAFGNLLNSDQDLASEKCRGYPYVNPLTGPIAVEGAEPGDALVVDIHAVEPARDFAVTALIPKFGGLTATDTTALLHEPLPERTRVLPLREGKVVFNERVQLPMRPFIGSIGVAPRMEAITSLSCGPWGGNMDCVETAPGHQLHLPVLEPGAMLFIGDAHACQGDGEVTGVAAEMAARIEVTLRLEKGRAPSWPRLVSETHIMTVGCARPLEDAARIAWKALVEWMVEDFGFETLEAYELLGLAGETRLGNMVDPNYSMVAKLERRYVGESG